MSYWISFLGVNKTGKLRKENEAKKVKKGSMLLWDIILLLITSGKLNQERIYLSRIQDWFDLTTGLSFLNFSQSTSLNSHSANLISGISLGD